MGAALLAAACTFAAAAPAAETAFPLGGLSLPEKIPKKPTNPFDYNYCGGERVYPVIGVNIATACGPRNQIAVGRRGTLSWFFPADHGLPVRQGVRKLTDTELTRVSLMAEVVQVADIPPPTAAPVQYKLGLNFSGRPYRRVHAGLTGAYTPSKKLLEMILEMVADHPGLPDCSGPTALFDPTLPKADRVRARRAVAERVE